MLDELRNIIANYTNIEIEEIRETSDLIFDLSLNSLDLANIIIGIEKVYKVSISDYDIGVIHTVKDIMECIVEKQESFGGDRQE